MKPKKNNGEFSVTAGTIILVAIAVVLVAIISAVIMGMCGASETQSASSDSPRIAEYPSEGIRIFVDPVTGVNYMTIYYTDGICPRYNADGSLYVSDVKA